MRVELVRAKTKFSSRGPAAPSSGAPSPILASRGSAGPHFSSGVKAHPDYPPSAVLTMREFSEALGISYFTVSRAVKRKELPAHRVGGAIRIIWGEAMEKTCNVAPAGGRVWL